MELAGGGGAASAVHNSPGNGNQESTNEKQTQIDQMKEMCFMLSSD